MATAVSRSGTMLYLLLGSWILLQVTHVGAAFVEFTNCLDEAVVTSQPRILQFVPLNISAFFNTTDGAHLLNVTIRGNVTGQLYPGDYPPPSDPVWTDPDDPFGKIVDVEPDAQLATTLFTTFNVLSYTPFNAQPARFCENSVGNGCPLIPAFDLNSTDINQLPGYSVGHDLASSYAFSTIAATTRIQSGMENAQYYGCVVAYITPDLGHALKGLLSYLPLGILAVVGVATISAAIYSPWGSIDIFHWSSNYGRDEDILRLVTPGFGDCLQYIQFVVFSGSLSLNYPGYYQPVVSRLGWSALLFNESMVTGGEGTNAIVDGIYQYRRNSRYGLDRITQLIGMTSPNDAWADMMVWLCVIIACVIVLTQIGFLLQWIYRQVKDVAPEDLRSKNWYFSVGNTVRIALGYFLLPLITLSMFQFIIASLGPTYAVALAAVVLILVITFSGWLVYKIINTKPRSYLFDDLQTVLLYGPLYNTYRDNTATFALVPILVNLLRGIAIGAVQDSGVAQIVMLAICEIILILTLSAFRPFSSATSMNLYHTCFAILRLLTLLLSIAFIPTLNIGTASRGWLGYVILLIHACVLVFGFFLNAIQTLIEVIARLAGAGASGGRDAARGGLTKVFGMRQLSRRLPRRDAAARSSMGSNAQMLTMQDENKEMILTQTRTRSASASSNLLLDGNRRKRASQVMDGSSHGHQTPDGMSTFSRLSKSFTPSSIVGIAKPAEAKDPYYRPPRRNTNDFMTTSGRSRLSGSQNDATLAEAVVDDGGEGSSSSPKRDREDGDDNGVELTKTKTDYAIREVDFYYGVRGPALSGSGGTRKLKTGPANPVAPAYSARGWFKGLLGGKTKDKGKGFEVVRSTRAPPGLFPATPDVDKEISESVPQDFYQDEPEGPVAKRPRTPSAGVDEHASFSTADASYMSPIARTSPDPPSLPVIDSFGGIELPSRIGSEASRKRPRPIDTDVPDVPLVPPVPRKSSRRMSSPRRLDDIQPPLLAATRSDSPTRSNRESQYLSSASQRLPFTRTSSNKQSNRDSQAISENSSYMDEPIVDEGPESIMPQREQQSPIERPESVGYVNQHRASDNIRYSPHEAQIPSLSTVEYGWQPSHNGSAQNQGAIQTPTTPWSPAWNGSSAYALNADGTQRFSRFRD